MERVKGLDQLRFLMAIIVLIGHGALPYFENKIVRGVVGNSFVGITAVMVFFILSGFVIHYPYASGQKKIKVIEFYLRRLLRIIIPAVIAFTIYQITFNLYMIVVWSLICEAIYYILYPIILKYINKIDLIIILAFFFSYLLSFTYSILENRYNGDFHRFGYLGTWIIGFPTWLLGVKLSILYLKFKKEGLEVSFKKITANRLFIFFLSWTCSVLRFHFEISYSYTLPVFSLFSFFWLRNELIYYLNRKENKVLVYGGSFSYSIYLIHSLVMFTILHYLNIKMLTIVHSILLVFMTLAISWLFYILFEKPSHKISRSITVG